MTLILYLTMYLTAEGLFFNKYLIININKHRMKKFIFLLAVIATVLVGCKDKSAEGSATTVDSTYVDTTEVVNTPQVEEPITVEPEQNDKGY